MGTKKPRDRRDRAERARQERRDLFQKERDRRRMVIEALARKRAARERARIDNEETALESFSRGSYIPTTSNLPHLGHPPYIPPSISRSVTLRTQAGRNDRLLEAPSNSPNLWRCKNNHCFRSSRSWRPTNSRSSTYIQTRVSQRSTEMILLC